MARSKYEKAFWLAASAAVAASAVPASAEVYLTEAQALATVFGEKAIVRREHKTLDEVLRKRLEQTSNLRFPESGYTFFIAAQDGKPAKYALVLNEIGKSEPITFMVGLSPDGKVSEVVIMEFRENRGWEVKEKRFLSQFRGKTVRNAIRVDEDIINYTGATLSSKAIARGVKRSLLLLDAFYPGEDRYKLAPTKDFVRPLPISPLVTVSDAEGTVGLYRQVRYAMGTQCEIRLWSRSAEDARRFCNVGFEELERIERIFSAYREGSELSQVNREAGCGPVQVSDEFYRLTDEAIRCFHESNGATDITVGLLLKVWGFREGASRVPTSAELSEARMLVGSGNVVLDPNKRSILFQRPGMELDFGGIAKGYAADRVALTLQGRGALSSLVSLGRSSLCASSVGHDLKPKESTEELGLSLDRWLVGLVHPSRKDEPLHLFLESGSSLSTSGTSVRGFTADGRWFSHVINPRTGMPLEEMCCATVVGQSGVRSEALSKELLLLDASDRPEWANKKRLAAWAHLTS